jgi:hypothetical protein
MTMTWRSIRATTILDLWNLPRDVWEDRLPASLRERGPRVVEQGESAWWTCDGTVMGMYGLSGPYRTGFSAISRLGIEDDGLRASNPDLRLEDMERDGVYASVIYGPNLFGLPIADPELKARVPRGVQRLGERVQSRGARTAVGAARAADARARRRDGGARARGEGRPPRRHHQPLRVPLHRSRVGPLLGRGRGDGAAGELPHRAGHVAGARRARAAGSSRRSRPSGRCSSTSRSR